MNHFSEFDDIRPFNEEEIRSVTPRLLQEPALYPFLKYIFPEATPEQLREKISSIGSNTDFIKKISYYGVQRILSTTSDGFSYSGEENVKDQVSYLFISNHRDIVLDTCLLNLLLFENQKVMTQSAIGNNLIKDNFLKTIAKLNNNFTVYRDLNLRETLESSRILSRYIHHVLNEMGQSIWIAQREGRTKDGNDHTHSGVLKMLCMASEDKPLVDYIKELRIIPMAISYEYDPTDILKIPQLLAAERHETYIKKENEDLNSILTGLTGYKGRIHISLGNPLDEELNELEALGQPSKQIRRLGEIIDERIHRLYRLWPTNYIAYDILYQTDKFRNEYNQEDIQKFEKKILERLTSSAGENARVNLLKMYAMPVVNQLSVFQNKPGEA